MPSNPPTKPPAWLVTYTYRTGHGTTGSQYFVVDADTAAQARALAWAKAQTPESFRHRKMAPISILQRRTAPARRIRDSEC